MIKNIWDMTKDEIALIKEKKYKIKKDFKKFMPSIGAVPNRELVNINDKTDILLFFRGINVNIINSV